MVKKIQALTLPMSNIENRIVFRWNPVASDEAVYMLSQVRHTSPSEDFALTLHSVGLKRFAVEFRLPWGAKLLAGGVFCAPR